MRISQSLLRMRRYLLSRVRSCLRESPTAFYYVMNLSKKHRGHLVTRRTDLVIEGYPRSANTYAVAAFQIAGHEHFSIASHAHSFTHVKRACGLGIPCLVLIRNPIDAIGSLGVRNNLEHFHHELDAYSNFYESVLPLRDRFVFVDFNDVTSRIEAVMRAVNQKYHLNLEELSNAQLAERKIFELIEAMEKVDSGTSVVRETHVARPSPARSHEKQQVLANLRRPIYHNDLNRCVRLYEFISKQTKSYS